jgi:hypothetical protein
MSDQWFYAVGGSQQSGPVTMVQLADLARAGNLRPNDLVWREGMPEWATASTVQGLFASASAPPPPPLASTGAPAQPLPYANLHAPPAHFQPYGGPMSYAGDARTAMILAIIGVFILGPILQPIALVLGYGARRKMRESGNPDGEGMAVAAITIGWIMCGLYALGVLAILTIIIIAAANS